MPNIQSLARNSTEHRTNGRANDLDIRDRAFHDWYRFVLSYPPHLVRHYIDSFGLTDRSCTLLDPFCGTGTSLIEARLSGIQAIGIEAHPFSAFASSVKVDWEVEAEALDQASHAISNAVRTELQKNGIDDDKLHDPGQCSETLRTLGPDLMKLLITIS